MPHHPHIKSVTWHPATTLREAEREAAQDFHNHEMATDTASDRAYDRFLAKVSALTGINDLDGNNTAEAQAAGTADGYSLDECCDWFDAGWTPERAAAKIAANREFPAPVGAFGPDFKGI